MGGTYQLIATTTPEDAPITWQSLDSEVATVNDSGLVTAIAHGQTTIMARITVDEVSYMDACAINVDIE